MHWTFIESRNISHFKLITFCCRTTQGAKWRLNGPSLYVLLQALLQRHLYVSRVARMPSATSILVQNWRCHWNWVFIYWLWHCRHASIQFVFLANNYANDHGSSGPFATNLFWHHFSLDPIGQPIWPPLLRWCYPCKYDNNSHTILQQWQFCHTTLCIKPQLWL